MKKGLILTASAMVMALACNVAEARDGFYLTGRGGMTWNNFNSKKDSVTEKKVTKLDHVGVFSGALGYKYKYLRGEFEYVWRDDADEDITTDDYGSGHLSLSSESYMFNMYLDFMPNYWISPYIGGGIGMSKIKMSNRGEGAFAQELTWEENKFTWQMGAGLSIRLNRCLNLDAGYRYYTLGKIEGSEVNTHEWYGGIRYTF